MLLLLRKLSMLSQRKPEGRYVRILANATDANNVFGLEILPRFRDGIVELDNLPERTQIERMFQSFGAFGIQLAEQAWCVKFA
jgi:hypothetical protein